MSGPPSSGPASERATLSASAARLLRILAVAALGIQLAAGAWSAASTAWEWLEVAKRDRKKSSDSVRRELFGEYALGLELAEARIPAGAPYLLLNEHSGGWYQVLQGDLAPRRAWWLDGEWRSLPAEWHTEGAPADAPRWVVVFRGERKAPTVMRTEEYLAR